ncbi:helix-turn-helix transcriptional regulator [Nitratireductor aquimarinus]|uniref:helix-turn-helix transcriptional regulator n=1 Tax=Nitratireductor aquimarinus TaxID=889300 RepID=UPI00398EE7D3
MQEIPEKFIPLKEAADRLGLHLWALRRAVNRGDIPSYTPFNKRRLVRLSEVIAAIEAFREGGGDV